MWDETVWLCCVQHAPQLLLSEFLIQVQQRDRMKRTIPEPLERVGAQRWANKAELLALPLRYSFLAIRG
jgi:hypothetical protein